MVMLTLTELFPRYSLPTILTGALLFATHPLHVEAVAYVPGSSAMLACFFSCASLYLFAVALRRARTVIGHVLALALCAVAGVLAVLSDPIGIATFALLAAYDLLFHTPSPLPLLLPSLPHKSAFDSAAYKTRWLADVTAVAKRQLPLLLVALTCCLAIRVFVLGMAAQRCAESLSLSHSSDSLLVPVDSRWVAAAGRQFDRQRERYCITATRLAGRCQECAASAVCNGATAALVAVVRVRVLHQLARYRGNVDHVGLVGARSIGARYFCWHLHTGTSLSSRESH